MKITIIIPVYNEQAHIEHMLGSLAGQTIKPSQVIIVDDNSTDNTPSIIKKYVDTYPWITTVNTHKESKHSPGSQSNRSILQGVRKMRS